MGALLRYIRAAARSHPAAMIIIAVAMVFLMVCVIQKKGRITTNPRSRFITVERLVERGTFAWTSPGDTTPFELSVDHVKLDGELYSSKPPAYPLLMAGESLALKAVTGWEFYTHRVDYMRYLLLLNQILPYTFLLLLAFHWLRQWGADKRTIYFLVAALSFGLLPFGYAATINNHTLSACLWFFAFYLVWRISHRNEIRWHLFFISGLLAGFAFMNELVSGPLLFAVLFLLARNNLHLTAFTVFGMALSALPDLIVYKSVGGSFLPHYLSGKYKYEGSYWLNPEGFDALKEPKWKYALYMLVGHHGVFTLTPLLLLPFLAVVKQWKQRTIPAHTELMLVAGSFFFTWLWLIRSTWNYGGDCIGLRWLLYPMPLLLLYAWPYFQRMLSSAAGRVAAVLLLAVSVPWVINAAWDEAFIPGWFYRLWTGAGLP